MANVYLVLGIVLTIIGAVMIAIASSITGILSTTQTDGLRSALLASTFFAIIGDILAIIAAILAIIYAGRRLSKTASKSYLIGFIVLLIVVVVIYLVVIGINIGIRGNPDFTTTEKNALTAAVIVFAIGLIFIALGAVFFFLAFSRGGKQGYTSIREGYTTIRSEPSATKTRTIVRTEKVASS